MRKTRTSAISLSLDSTASSRSLSLLKAALPHLEKLEPHRAKAVISVLQQLSLLEQERVILAMPVIQLAD